MRGLTHTLTYLVEMSKITANNMYTLGKVTINIL